MYRRDFGVLFLSLFAIFWALQHEGTYQYYPAFYHQFDKDPGYLETPGVAPPPVVADLNGDGQLEIILITHQLELQVIAPALSARDGSGFAKAAVKGSKEVMLGRMRLGGRKPIALAAGYLDAPHTDVVHMPRKMVIVVVTSGWVVMVFDHNLQLMWDESIQAKFPHHASVREVAVHISNHTVTAGDRGMIAVGGSVSLGDIGSKAADADGTDDSDPFFAELQLEEEELYRSRNRKAGTLGEIKTDVHGVDLSRNFQWHAYEGGHGAERWHTTGTDFHADLDQLAEVLIPQHNYKLDAVALQGRSYGQATCREYRDSVMHSLPHSWERRDDTRIHSAYFAKSKEGRGAAKKHLGGGARRGAVSAPEAEGLRHHQGINEQAALSSTIGGIAAVAGASGAAAEGQMHPQLHHHRGQPPNAFVAHLEEGIEVVHMYSGKPLCKLALPQHQLHADLNGDGVMDHVIAVGSETHVHTGQHKHAELHNCWAYATSGMPAKSPLFNGTLCMTGHLFDGLSRGVNRHESEKRVEMAKPIMMPKPTSNGHYRAVRGQHGYAVFLNSRGELTAYNAHGRRMWSAQTGATWLNHASDRPSERVSPTLLPLALHRGAVPSAIVVAGTHTAAIYGVNGNRIDHFELPAAPSLPMVAADFTGDGLTDLLLITRTHVYGFELVKHLGAGLPYAAMLGCLLIATLVVYITQQGPAAAAKKRFRSTDRVD